MASDDGGALGRNHRSSTLFVSFLSSFFAQSSKHIDSLSDSPKNAPLHLDAFQRRVVQLLPPRRARVAHHDAVQPEICGVAHRARDAHVRRNPAHDQAADSAHAQHQREVGVAKRAAAGLVDDGLGGEGRELGDDVVAGLAAHEQAAEGAPVADADARGAAAAAAGEVALRERAEVGPVALARVVDGVAGAAEGGEEGADAGDDGAGRGDGEAGVVGVAAWFADCFGGGAAAGRG